jgi:murein tripeptide amidase MpaA
MRVVIPEDSGNAADIEVVEGAGHVEVRFALRPDTIRAGGQQTAHRQWFWLRCEGVAGVPLTVRLVRASSASYPRGWSAYRAVASGDGEDWFRVDTRLDAEADELVITHTPTTDSLDLAYFAPYPHARREARTVALRRRGVDVADLGPTPDGWPLPMITVGAGPAPIWIVARQHPGETMGEWFAEGLVDRLVAAADSATERLLALATIRVVPCVNPDGARRGNHRTNAMGADLNRAWLEPDPVRSPEVLAIRAAMDRTGVAFALDVHGDEEIPYVFPTGAGGTPSWDAERAEQRQRFLDAWMAATPHLQTRHGYPPTGPGEANLSVCSNQLTERFRCVALTIEQPFADHDDDPDPRTGWSPTRSRALGASVVEALSKIVA